MKDVLALICKSVIANYNNNSREGPFKGTVRPSLPPEINTYSTGKNADGTLCMDEMYYRRISAIIKEGIDKGLFSADWDSRRNIYYKIRANQEQVENILREFNWVSKAQYQHEIYQLLRENLHSSVPPIRAWAEAELSRSTPDCMSWTRYNMENQNCGKDAASFIRKIVRGCEHIVEQKEDILRRNFSSMEFGDSKFLEKHEEKFAAVLDPETDDRKQMFQQYNLLENPASVWFKGFGRIAFRNGETMTLGGPADAMAFSPYRFSQVRCIHTENILTIENLTTFNDYMNQDGLVVFTSGYANNLVVDFLRLTIRTSDLQRISHFGDMDGYGFDILRNLSERICCPITPWKMNLETFEKYENKAKAMTPGNRQKFHLLLDSAFEKREKDLFRYLLKTGKMLEQEAIR